MTLALETTTSTHPRLRTAGALIAGFAAVFILSSGADAILRATGYYANDGTVGSDPELALALAYRTIFTIIGGAVTAWLAASRPVRLATILGAIGTLPAILGVVGMWGVGHQWYGISLAVLALPSTALGGWLFTRFAR